jgi:hypothetical protein
MELKPEPDSRGVQVSIPERHPTTISKFATEADATAWITEHQRRVQAEGQAGRWFRQVWRHPTLDAPPS